MIQVVLVVRVTTMKPPKIVTHNTSWFLEVVLDGCGEAIGKIWVVVSGVNYPPHAERRIDSSVFH